MRTFEFQLELRHASDMWAEQIPISVQAEDHIEARNKVGNAISFLVNNLEDIKAFLNNDGK